MGDITSRSDVIFRCQKDDRIPAAYRVLEVLKTDNVAIADNVKVGADIAVASIGPGGSNTVTDKLVFLGKPIDNAFIRRDNYAEYAIVDGKVPGFGGVSVEDIRTMAAKNASNR